MTVWQQVNHRPDRPPREIHRHDEVFVEGSLSTLVAKPQHDKVIHDATRHVAVQQISHSAEHLSRLESSEVTHHSLDPFRQPFVIRHRQSSIREMNSIPGQSTGPFSTCAKPWTTLKLYLSHHDTSPPAIHIHRPGHGGRMDRPRKRRRTGRATRSCHI